MRFLVNQLFVYSVLIAALICLALLIGCTPISVLNIAADARGWAIGFVACWAVVGVCLGVDTCRFLSE